jgi:uncharacterized membrane protein (GlpM family)
VATIQERVVPVVLSVLVIVLVSLLQGRSRYLAAIIAAMPLTAPLAMWIVFSASRGDQRQMADFVASLVVGFAAAFLFVVACWIGFRQAWGFLVTLSVASVVWLAAVSLPRLVDGWR